MMKRNEGGMKNKEKLRCEREARNIENIAWKNYKSSNRKPD